MVLIYNGISDTVRSFKKAVLRDFKDRYRHYEDEDNIYIFEFPVLNPEVVRILNSLYLIANDEPEATLHTLDKGSCISSHDDIVVIKGKDLRGESYLTLESLIFPCNPEYKEKKDKAIKLAYRPNWYVYEI